MNMSWRWGVVVVTGAALLLGCPKKKDGGGDAASDAAAVAVVEAAAPEPTLPTAANEADIAHFGDETKLTGESAKLLSAVIARKSPLTGAHIATLKVGTDVQKLAQREKAFLVLFANPNKAGEMIGGWIPESGFSPPVLAPGSCKTDKDCKKGQICLTVPAEKTTRCVAPCHGTAECSAGQTCDGEGYIANGPLQEFCLVQRDAGAAPVVDAGAPVADAGAAPAPVDAGAAPPAAQDAGAPPPPPPPPPPARDGGRAGGLLGRPGRTQ